MKSLRTLALFIWIVSFATSFANAAGYTVSGRIIKSDGTPLEYNAAAFIFNIMSPDGSCIIYTEQINSINLTGSLGRFSVVLGSGTRSFPSTGITTAQSVMNNSTAYTCSVGGKTYTPAVDDGRLLRVTFYDGASWQTFSPDQMIRAVPYASEAKNTQTFSGYTSSEFIRVAGTPAPVLNSTDIGNLTSLLSGSSNLYIKTESDPTVKPFAKASLPTCTTGQVLKSDGTNFTCVTPATSGATGTASGDLSGTYPSPTVAALQGVAVSAAAPGANQVLRYDSTNSKWAPVNLSTSDIAGLSSTLSTYQTTASFNAMVSSAGCNPNQTMYWNSVSSNFQCQNISLAVTVGGDLSGTATAATVSKINGQPIDTTVTPSSGQFLKYISGKWTPSTVSVGTVTSVTATLPISVSNATSTPMIAINKATTSIDGYLAATDFTNFNGAATAVSAATNANTASTLVKRDASGNFTAGTITASLAGNASSATTATTATSSTYFTGPVSGDISGTQSATSVDKIKGVPVDVSAGYQDGDSLVYSSGKWVLKRANGCESGWSKVSKGAPFCIKNLGPTAVNYYQAIAQCGTAGGDLCSLSQLANSCTSGVMATSTTNNTTWTNILDASDYGRIIRCESTSNVLHSSTNYGSTQATLNSTTSNIVPYCCKPAN